MTGQAIKSEQTLPTWIMPTVIREGVWTGSV